MKKLFLIIAILLSNFVFSQRVTEHNSRVQVNDIPNVTVGIDSLVLWDANKQFVHVKYSDLLAKLNVDIDKAVNLDELLDVTITTPASQEILTYNGTNWINQVFTAGSESDPIYVAWDKSTGISITESQVSDLTHTTDTTIDSTGIAALGFVAGAHTTDTNLTDGEIGAMGYIKVSTDDQTLSLSGFDLSIESGNTVDLSALTADGGIAFPINTNYTTIDGNNKDRGIINAGNVTLLDTGISTGYYINFLNNSGGNITISLGTGQSVLDSQTLPQDLSDGNYAYAELVADNIWSVVIGGQIPAGSGGVTDHTLLTSIGTNTHLQIDTHIADATTHFTEASISITESQISNLTHTVDTDTNIDSIGIAALGFVAGAHTTDTNLTDGEIGAMGYIKTQTDDQTLSLVGPNLSIENGNTVDLSGLGGGVGGDVFKSGTTFNNHVGVWVSDGVLEGTTGLTFDSITNELRATNQYFSDFNELRFGGRFEMWTGSGLMHFDMLSANIVFENNGTDLFQIDRLTGGLRSYATNGTITSIGSTAVLTKDYGDSNYGSLANVTTNNAKVTNATHTGDVTGSTTLTIGANKVLESHLKAVNVPTDEYVLTYEATTGDFEWQPDLGGGDVYKSGTPTVGQLSMWVDSQTIEAATGLTYISGAGTLFSTNYYFGDFGRLYMSDAAELWTGSSLVHLDLLTDNFVIENNGADLFQVDRTTGGLRSYASNATIDAIGNTAVPTALWIKEEKKYVDIAVFTNKVLHTCSSSDYGQITYFDGTSLTTITVSDALSPKNGQIMTYVQKGTGQITIDPTGTTTLNGSTASIKTDQNAKGMPSLQLIHISGDDYQVIGDIE